MRQRRGNPLLGCCLRCGNAILGCCLCLSACLVHLRKCAQSPRHGISWQNKLECTERTPTSPCPMLLHAWHIGGHTHSLAHTKAGKRSIANWRTSKTSPRMLAMPCALHCRREVLHGCCPRRSGRLTACKQYYPRLLVELHAHLRQRCSKALLRCCLRRSVRLGACLAHLGTLL